MENVETEVAIMRFDGSERRIGKLGSKIHIGAVENRFATHSDLHVSTILGFRHIVAVNAITRIDDEITGAVLGLRDIGIFMRLRFAEFEEFFQYFLSSFLV